MNVWIRGLLVLVVVGGISACAQPTRDQADAERMAAEAAAAEAERERREAEARGVGIDGELAVDPLDDPRNLLGERLVYFDYDRDALRDEFVALLEAHARYLADNPGARVRLEGHADERGTREYNLGLGERRAQAVRRVLSIHGARDNQLEVISYGEEMPVAFTQTEESWALNRRVELVYEVRR